jgi:hypothetical protein
MKKLFPALLLCFFVQNSVAQKNKNRVGIAPDWQISGSAGLIGMTGLPSGIDEQISFGSKLEILRNLRLSPNNYLSFGFGYESNAHIVDGTFYKAFNDYSFALTLPLVKQNELRLDYIHLPIMYKYNWLNSASINFGPYFSYLINARSRYKVGTDKFKDNLPIQNEFHYGLRAEMDGWRFDGKSSKTGSVFGLGLQYQLSRHIDGERSFKPLFAYLKFGIVIK